MLDQLGIRLLVHRAIVDQAHQGLLILRGVALRAVRVGAVHRRLRRRRFDLERVLKFGDRLRILRRASN